MHDKDRLLAAHHRRCVVFDGACNVRDLGGLPTADGRSTRFGVIYRADTLAYLTDLDLERFNSLQVRSVVDLRSDHERQRAPDRLPESPILTVHTPGFIPNGNDAMIAAINAGTVTAQEAFDRMLGQYRNLTLDHLDEYRRYLAVLLESDRTPLIFHCASGKDRTGIAAAITLLAVGVPLAQVIEDYVLSTYQRRPVDLFVNEVSAAVVEQVMAADARYLEAALSAMHEQFGSIAGYLADGLGLDAAARARLCTLLVE